VDVLVFGAGAIGSLFGARLAQAGHRVTLVARPGHVAAIRARGLEIDGTRPAHVPVVAIERLEPGVSADRAILAVKTFDLADGARALARGLPTPVATLLPQNGLDIESVAAAALDEAGWTDPARWMVRTVHSVPATWLGPGRVRQAGEGEILLPRPTDPPHGATEAWASLLGDMGYPVRRVESIDREVWRKVILNAAINPVTADHGIPNGRLRQDPWRGQALGLLAEAAEVAAAEQVPFDPAELERDLWRVVGATATNRSSMLQDLDRGRPTEIDAISGRLLVRGRAHGLALPLTARAVERLRARVRERSPGTRPPGDPAAQPS
jgi:2-dehydropantoate 2-reductase